MVCCCFYFISAIVAIVDVVDVVVVVIVDVVDVFFIVDVIVVDNTYKEKTSSGSPISSLITSY